MKRSYITSAFSMMVLLAAADAASGAAPAARQTKLMSKLAVKDLGNPRAVADEDGKRRIYLGRLGGIAEELKEGADNTGRPFIGFRGSFMGIPAEADKPTIRSGVCYLPPGTEGQLVSILRRDAEGKREAANASFAFDIYAIVAKNPIGYSYETVPVMNIVETDPVAQAMASLPAPGGNASVAQITDAKAAGGKK